MDKDYIITRKEKTKNPGRVEAGKRPAIYNKERKARLESERSECCEAENESSSTGFGAVYAIGFLTVVVLGGVYFAKGYLSPNTPPPQEEPKQEKRTINFINFDD